MLILFFFFGFKIYVSIRKFVIIELCKFFCYFLYKLYVIYEFIVKIKINLKLIFN